jgi:hypothetical protein
MSEAKHGNPEIDRWADDLIDTMKKLRARFFQNIDEKRLRELQRECGRVQAECAYYIPVRIAQGVKSQLSKQTKEKQRNEQR